MVFPGVEVYGSTRKWHAMRALQIFFDQLLCSVGAFECREFGKQASVEKRWEAKVNGRAYALCPVCVSCDLYI